MQPCEQNRFVYEADEDFCARLPADAAQAPCGFSLGAAVREGRESLAETLARADAAMYAARSRVRAQGSFR